MFKQNKQENLIYLVVWLFILVSPIATHYFHTTINHELQFDWHDVFHIWKVFAVFLVAFLIHNFFIAPLLVVKRRKWLYTIATVGLIAGTVAYQMYNHPDHPRGRHHHDERPAMVDGSRPPRGEYMRPPRHHGERSDDHRPPIGMHSIMSLMTIVMLVGSNLGVKLFFHSLGEQQRLAEAQREHLEQELEYLRYQVNPHFFMNTLNNIHALVDIEPERARRSIIELSKMMRYVLYDGAKESVSLEQCIGFIKCYISLMRMRYDDKVVDVRVDVPDEVPAVNIPPLLMIPFVENAFKHGVSYKSPSFVHVKVGVTTGGEVSFRCRNSVIEAQRQAAGGVGLTNVKRRLNLIYGEDGYRLTIGRAGDTFEVSLSIHPL